MLSRKKKKFRVLIEGENLFVDVRRVEKLGFFTTRYVEGFDVDEACECALDLVRNELNATGALFNEINDPPLAVVSEVAQVASFRGISVPGRGFSFFPDHKSE